MLWIIGEGNCQNEHEKASIINNKPKQFDIMMLHTTHHYLSDGGTVPTGDQSYMSTLFGLQFNIYVHMLRDWLIKVLKIIEKSHG